MEDLDEDRPLEFIFREIERSLAYGLYYSPIAVTLSIPDICAALECDPGRVWVKKLAAFEPAHGN